MKINLKKKKFIILTLYYKKNFVSNLKFIIKSGQNIDFIFFKKKMNAFLKKFLIFF